MYIDASLILKIADGGTTEVDAKDLLYDICDSVHASCDNSCPVYYKFGGIPWDADRDNCKVFKSGRLMLIYVRTGNLPD